MTNRQSGVVAIAGASAFDALARRHVTEGLATTAARVGKASALALEIGGAGRRRGRAIAVGNALHAFPLAASTDRSTDRAMVVAHARYADLALGVAERMVSARAIGVADADHASSAGGVALLAMIARDGAARSAGNMAGVVGGGAGVDRRGTIVVAGAHGASAAHAPRLGGGASIVIR